MVKNDAGTSARGAKLATGRTLLDSAGLRTPVALSAMQVHDMAACRPVLTPAPVLRAGDLRLEARGCSDGATLSALKRTRKVDGIRPLQAHRLATPAAMQRAAMAQRWDAHPSRAAPRMAWGRGVEPLWPECHGPLNAWVMRLWTTKTKRTDHSVVVTTDQELRASWIVRHAEERPEIAQDDEQLKRGGGQRKQRSATR